MIALGMEQKGCIQEQRRNKYCRGKESKFSIDYVKYTGRRYTFGV